MRVDARRCGQGVATALATVAMVLGLWGFVGRGACLAYAEDADCLEPTAVVEAEVETGLSGEASEDAADAKELPGDADEDTPQSAEQPGAQPSEASGPQAHSAENEPAAVVADGASDAKLTAMSGAVRSESLGEMGADAASETVRYINEKGEEAEVPRADCSNLSTSKTGWLPLQTGWYIVTKSATLDGRAMCYGDVKIIIFDRARLTFTGGINVGPGKSLTIYSQAGGTHPGQLVCEAGARDDEAGIGGNDDENCGSIRICGCEVRAAGGEYAAGIGGGHDGHGGNITICSGKVIATGGKYAAGIGGGSDGCGGTIVIRGGDVTATGGRYDGHVAPERGGGAGIGGGYGQPGGDINIFGGKVRGNGGYGAAGIGRGSDYNYRGGKSKGYLNKITIKDSTVVADGGGRGNGIDCGFGASPRTVEICNARVIAVGWGAAGIHCRNCSVHISGGQVDADSKEWDDKSGAGIGGDAEEVGGNVVIEDGAVVKATSALSAAIGRGSTKDDATRIARDHGTLKLYDGAKVCAEKTAECALRGEFCKWRRSVTISPCDHVGSSYETDETSHRLKCPHCKGFTAPHDFDADGCCTACGYKRTTFAFTQTKLLAPQGFGLTFWLLPPSEVAVDAKVRLSVGGKAARSVELALSEGVKGEGGKLGFSMPLATIEAAEPVTCAVSCGDVGLTETASVMDCALATNGEDTPESKLCIATANLAHELQRYLADEKGFKLGSDYAEANSPYVNSYDANATRAGLAGHEGRLPEGEGPVAEAKMLLAFGSLTRMDLYLTPRERGALDGMTARFGDASAQVDTLADGRVRVRVRDIAPADLDRRVCLYAADGEPLGVELSALSYAQSAYAKGGKAKPAMAALWWYFKACKEMV